MNNVIKLLDEIDKVYHDATERHLTFNFDLDRSPEDRLFVYDKHSDVHFYAENLEELFEKVTNYSYWWAGILENWS